jgi:ribosome-binding factor A
MKSHRPFDRHDRVRSLLTEKVAEFVRTEANTNPLITITNLTISPDYRNVTVFFTTIPDTGEADALIFMKRKGGELRQYLKTHCHLKVIPNLDFMIDYGERHRQHIDDVARRIQTEEQAGKPNLHPESE